MNSTNGSFQTEKSTSKKHVTPHELMDRQIKHFDYHVSDEDMDNMEISDRLPEEQKAYSNEQATILDKDNTGTSYNTADSSI